MPATPLPDSSPLHPARQWWQQRAPRERRMLTAAILVVAAGLLWAVLIAPARHTLRTAPAQQAVLDQQLEQMRTMQATAHTLRAQPVIRASDSRDTLTALSQRLLGDDALAIQGAMATATLRNVPAQQLADWLQQARTTARAVPTQARMQYSAAGWNGRITLRLPSE